MKQVAFTQMKDGTAEEYGFLEGLERDWTANLADRLLDALARLDGAVDGYKISRLGHSLQSAARAADDGADDDMIVGALLHDIGDLHAPANHSAYAAAILRPYVRPEVAWVVDKHGLFQRYYYAHHLGADRNGRDKYKSHEWYESCATFCERWDQASFDPTYPTPNLTTFEPLVRAIFARAPYGPDAGPEMD